MISYEDSNDDKELFSRFVLLSLIIHCIILVLVIRLSARLHMTPPDHIIIVDVRPLDVQHRQLPMPNLVTPPVISRSAVRSETVAMSPSRQPSRIVSQKMASQGALEMSTTAPARNMLPAPPVIASPPPLPPVSHHTLDAENNRKAHVAPGISQQETATSITMRNSVRADYLALLRGMIDRYKEYPLMARKGGLEGTVVVRFTLSRDGALKECIIVRSCGRSLLDKAAVQTITTIGKFPPVPEEIRGGNVSLDVPVTYRLSD